MSVAVCGEKIEAKGTDMRGCYDLSLRTMPWKKRDENLALGGDVGVFCLPSKYTLTSYHAYIQLDYFFKNKERRNFSLDSP